MTTYTTVQSFPGYDAVNAGIKDGTMKIVKLYNNYVVKDGKWVTEYSDTPGMTWDYENGFYPASLTPVLKQGNTVYGPTNDWTIAPVTQTETKYAGTDSNGDPIYTTTSTPTGQLRIRSRSDNNVFNEMLISADSSGNINGYNPNIYQTGSNAGTGFLGGVQGLLSNPLVPIILSAALPGAGTAIGTALGLEGAAATIAGNTLINTALNGGDAEKALVSSVIGQGINAAGSSLGSTEALPEGVGYNPETMPTEQAVLDSMASETPIVGQPIQTPTIEATQLPSVQPSVTQPDYLAADAAATDKILQDPFAYTTEDLSNPLADTTATAPTSVATPAETLPPSPSDYLTADAEQTVANDVNSMSNIGMTEAEAQDQFYKSIGIDPASLSDLPPASTEEINQILQGGTNINASDISKIKNIISTANTAKNLLGSTGLLGGAAAALAGAGAVKALTGGTTATAAPVSQAGTYSGIANYSPAYYQQLQQNYNRLFPTAPMDVATPLKSWYDTKFVPDTSISNKLFGI